MKRQKQQDLGEAIEFSKPTIKYDGKKVNPYLLDEIGCFPMPEDLTIKDSDIATIEALHDLLLDGEGYPLSHPTLVKSRKLTDKLYKIVGFNKAKGKMK